MDNCTSTRAPICATPELTRRVETYFRDHREEWRTFVREFVGLVDRPPLEVLAKFFVIKANLPFDMQAYMRAQAEFIRRSVASLGEIDPAERQVRVAEWLKTNAQRHRDEVILEQTRCVEAVAQSLVPLLREMVADILDPENLMRSTEMSAQRNQVN